MNAVQKKYLSEKDYLLQERDAFFKSEYCKGEVIAMDCAAKDHNKIVASVVGEIGQTFKGKNCSIMCCNMRIHNPLNSLYTYPDIVITCEEEKYLDDELDTLLNPTILIEVLSKSTQDYDRGTKFFLYRSIPSLKQYILISSLEHSIEVYTRDGEQWILDTFNNLEDDIHLSAIDYRFKLKDMYSQVPELGR